jgi:hypothetical protein
LWGRRRRVGDRIKGDKLPNFPKNPEPCIQAMSMALGAGKLAVGWRAQEERGRASKELAKHAGME